MCMRKGCRTVLLGGPRWLWTLCDMRRQHGTGTRAFGTSQEEASMVWRQQFEEAEFREVSGANRSV
jgi:hypothetical protein